MAHFRMAPHPCQCKSISVSHKSHRYRRRYERGVRLKADTTGDTRAKAGSNRYLGPSTRCDDRITLASRGWPRTGRLGTPTRLPRWGPRPAGRGGVSRDKRFSPSTPGVPTARTLRGGVAPGVPTARTLRGGVAPGVPTARTLRGGVARTGLFADRTRHG
jgi:hypothetical protein